MRKSLFIFLSILAISFTLKISHLQPSDHPSGQPEGLNPPQPTAEQLQAYERINKFFQSDPRFLTKEPLSEKDQLEVGLLTLKFFFNDPYLKKSFLDGINEDDQLGWVSLLGDKAKEEFFKIVLSVDQKKVESKEQLDRLKSELKKNPTILKGIEEKFGQGDDGFAKLFNKLTSQASTAKHNLAALHTL